MFSDKYCSIYNQVLYLCALKIWCFCFCIGKWVRERFNCLQKTSMTKKKKGIFRYLLLLRQNTAVQCVVLHGSDLLKGCTSISWSCSSGFSATPKKRSNFCALSRDSSISKPYLSSLWPDFLHCFLLSLLKKQLLAFVLKTTEIHFGFHRGPSLCADTLGTVTSWTY